MSFGPHQFDPRNAGQSARPENEKPAANGFNRRTGLMGPEGSGFGFILQNLTPTVEAIRADVVAQMGLARRRLNGDSRNVERVVRTVHASLGRRFFVLLDGHVGSFTL